MDTLQIAGLYLIVLILGTNQNAPADDAKQQAAIKATESWLQLIDAGKYEQSWEEAALLFKNAISKEDWNKTIKAARDPFGKLLSRKLKSAQYQTSLPGAPDGEYVIIQYDSSLENKKTAVETVTPMLDKDGKWKVSGYFIR